MRSPYRLSAERKDEGYFGPGSLVWELNAHPCVVHAAVINALIFELLPSCATLSDSVDSLYSDPVGRARRTLTYIHHVVYGDTATAQQAASFVRRLHDTIVVEYPADSGRTISAADPDQLLWLHMSQGDALLRAHRAYGRGSFTAKELDRFWSEFRPFAELQGVPRSMVPDSQAAADEYFARVSADLRRTDAGDRAIAQVMRPDVDGGLGLVLKLALRVIGPAAVDLIDAEHQRLLGRAPRRASRMPSSVANKALVTSLNTRFTRQLVPLFAGPTAAYLAKRGRVLERESRASGRAAAQPPAVVLAPASARAQGTG